jgi:DNA-3-methyladenine glycosylase II
MDEIIRLDINSEAVKYLCGKDKRLSKVIDMVGPITYKVHHDPYAFLVHEIIEQMLSIKAGAAIYGRLQALCGGEVTPKAISALSDEEIKSAGTSRPKVNYIRSLTDSINTGVIDFHELPNLTDADVIKKLSSVKGIGKWSAKMYLIFVLNRPDVLPFEDAAFLQSYKWLYKTIDCTPTAVNAKCKKWKPYSSIAARYMYRALDMGLTKNAFHLFK